MGQPSVPFMLDVSLSEPAHAGMSSSETPIDVPGFVPFMLGRSADDLRWIEGVIDRASDIEWVSDVADIYRARLTLVRQMVLNVHSRVREAATAVRLLEVR